MFYKQQQKTHAIFFYEVNIKQHRVLLFLLTSVCGKRIENIHDKLSI